MQASPLNQDELQLVDEAHDRSLDVLRTNTTRHGMVASSDRQGANYYAVWGRDGSIAALGALLSGDPELERAAVRTLLTLAKYQADIGQIPAYLQLDDKEDIIEVVYGGLGNVTAIDSNLWFLIACYTAVTHTGREELLGEGWFDVYHKTLRHLQSLDSNCCGLIEVPVAGDWSDILDRSYHILYDEVLWHQALRYSARLFERRGETDTRDRLDHSAQLVRDRLNTYFWWDRERIEPCIDAYFLGNSIPTDRDYPYFQSHLKPFTNYWYERFDSLGNVLACLMGVASPMQCAAILEHIIARRLNEPYPLRVLDPPIMPDDKDWDALYEQKEKPYRYHNGAAWPLAGAFWVILLAAMPRTEMAWRELHRLAEMLRAGATDHDNWGFHEHFHGKTGEPLGHRMQSWNAAGYLLAHAAVVRGQFACFESGLDREDISGA